MTEDFVRTGFIMFPGALTNVGDDGVPVPCEEKIEAIISEFGEDGYVVLSLTTEDEKFLEAHLVEAGVQVLSFTPEEDTQESRTETRKLIVDQSDELFILFDGMNVSVLTAFEEAVRSEVPWYLLLSDDMPKELRMKTIGIVDDIQERIDNENKNGEN